MNKKRETQLSTVWDLAKKGLISKRVQIYYNLHRGCLSVKYRGIVVAYVDSINLEDVAFKVSEKGRQRVLLEQRKNVHAVLEGTFVLTKHKRKLKTLCTYNPYRYQSFVLKANEHPIYRANCCAVMGKRILVR